MGDCIPCQKNKKRFSQQFVEKLEKKVNEIKTFSQAVKSVKSGEAYIAPPEIRENRLKICSKCEEIKRADNSKKQGDNVEIGDHCGICGCFLRGSKIINAFLPDFCKTCYIGDNFKCPKEKWGDEYQ